MRLISSFSSSLIVRKCPQYDNWSLITSSQLKPTEELPVVSIAMLNSERVKGRTAITTQRSILAAMSRRLISI